MSSESFEYGSGYGHESGTFEAEYPTGEADLEFDFSSEHYETGESEAEVQEMEAASSLMELNSEQDLEQFLGDLISKASSTIGDISRSPVGQALGGILKSAAKQALPIAGQALGTYIGGPAGGQLGSQLATKAGQIFGLEVEGLSHEDRDFEVTRQFVKFGNEAARRAAHEARHRGGANRVSTPVAQQIAKSAAVEAAKQFAPGLLKPSGSTPAPASNPPAPSRSSQAQQPSSSYAPSADAPPRSFQSAPSPSGGGQPFQPGQPYGIAPGAPGGAGHHHHHHKSGRWIRKGHSIVLLNVH
jgi:hypothetical protein